jgi:hypothetical protein
MSEVLREIRGGVSHTCFLSYPLVILECMPYSPSTSPTRHWIWSAICPQCGTEFGANQLTGRHRLYCTRNCRQKAYEARRALGAQLIPIRPSNRPIPFAKETIRAYHAGRAPARNVEHAIVLGLIDGRYFRTLCGTLALPLPRCFGSQPHFAPECKTCRKLVKKYPPVSPLKTYVDALRDEESERRAGAPQRDRLGE